jgi:hypothetical protein
LKIAMKFMPAIAVSMVALLVAACGGKDAGHVTRADMGDSWPLSVSEGTLHCEGKDGVGAVTFTANGTAYAVNGLAKAARYKGRYKDIDAIWAKGDGYQPKKDIGPLIQRGLTLCK